MRISFFVCFGVVFNVLGCHQRIQQSNFQAKVEQNGSYLVCLGNEPFWILRIYADSLLLQTPEQEPIVFNRVQDFSKGSDSKTIEAIHPIHQNLIVEIIAQPCKDSMSGEMFEFSANVIWQGKIFNGCAKYEQLKQKF